MYNAVIEKKDKRAMAGRLKSYMIGSMKLENKKKEQKKEEKR